MYYFLNTELKETKIAVFVVNNENITLALLFIFEYASIIHCENGNTAQLINTPHRIIRFDSELLLLIEG